jgi:hypothetical protein
MGAVLHEHCVVVSLDLSQAFEQGIRGSHSNNHDETNGRQASPTNLLFIMTDQMRFDALGFVQRRRDDYKGLVTIRTPNIDALAEQGINFETAYCVSPRFVSHLVRSICSLTTLKLDLSHIAPFSCGPSRASIKTGCTVQRNGILDNKLFKDKYKNRMDMLRSKIDDMVSFEQILVSKVSLTAQYS